MQTKTRLALVGAGAIGKAHVNAIHRSTRDIDLAAIVDPTDDARAFAESVGIPWYHDLTAMFADHSPDGAIIATPNKLHVSNGLDCIANGCPILVEKPIASSAADARALLIASETAGVPILVGHHRRHNPLVQAAKHRIEQGDIGEITMIQSSCWFFKPHDYYDLEWRQKRGAGPTIVNAIHDADLLHYFCGDVVEVSAMASNSYRGFEIENSLVANLRFRSGALGTLSVSDAAVSPWSWELTAGENPDYPKTNQDCYHISGTEGAISLPHNLIWHHPAGPDWKSPIAAVNTPSIAADPLVAQLANFDDVIRGHGKAVVTGQDGLAALVTIEAMLKSAETKAPVAIP